MRDNVSEPFDGPSAGRILTERNVGSNLIVIGRVFREDSPKVLSVHAPETGLRRYKFFTDDLARF